MPDDVPNESDAAPDAADEITKLRNEFAEQLNALKTSFEAEICDKNAKIEALQADNDALHRAVVRSAITQPEPVKTPEQEYSDKIAELADIALKYSEAYR